MDKIFKSQYSVNVDSCCMVTDLQLSKPVTNNWQICVMFVGLGVESIMIKSYHKYTDPCWLFRTSVWVNDSSQTDDTGEYLILK